MPENNDVISILQREKSRLEKIICKTEMRLAKAPEGNLRIQRHGKGYQYFLRKDPKDKNGIYIPASERKKALVLIQKGYDQQILAAAKKQAAVIDKFLKKYDPDVLKEVYNSLIEARKIIVEPVELPDDLYAKHWQMADYEHKIISETIPCHYTIKGERVRSKSEVLIADALNRAGIPYRYEYPMQVSGQIIHPDFTVLRKKDRKEFIWEHFGMIDDSEYRNNAMKRILQFEKEDIFPGDKLIVTAETQKQPLNTTEVNRVIRHYLV